MNIALWIVQALLAAAFLMAGGMKLATPIDELLANGMAFVELMPTFMVRFIGLAEVAGALGLILPLALKIAPKLTPIAAASLALVMLMAAGTHVYMGDLGSVVPTLFLGGLSGFVAWGRWTSHSVVNGTPVAAAT